LRSRRAGDRLGGVRTWIAAVFLALATLGAAGFLWHFTHPWHLRAWRVRKGMTRTEVERLLPPRWREGGVSMGGVDLVSYWLDRRWLAIVKYSAVPGADGVWEERALEVPTLERADCPEPLMLRSDPSS
jgi:hypothetical protein